MSDPRWIAEDNTPFEERLYNAHHQSSLTKAEENEQLYWLGDRDDVNEATYVRNIVRHPHHSRFPYHTPPLGPRATDEPWP